MANLSMNLGDKVIFDANDATNPNTTYMTNPSAATNPNNTIEVYCNGTKRAEFQNTKMILSGDLEFSAANPYVKATSHMTVAFAPPGSVLFEITSNGDKLLEVTGGGTIVSGQFSFGGASAADRILSMLGDGDFEIDMQRGANFFANSKGSYAAAQVAIYNHTTLLASFGPSGSTITGSLTSGQIYTSGIAVTGNLTATGIIASTGDMLCSTDVIATGLVIGQLGVRTKATGTAPSLGTGVSGDLVVYTGAIPKLYVNVAGTWKSVGLT